MALNIATSSNVRGLGDFKKRREIFYHLHSKNFYIILLQETHSSKQFEKRWKSEWRGQVFYSHGTTNVRGVMTLISRKVKVKILRIERGVKYSIKHIFNT